MLDFRAPGGSVWARERTSAPRGNDRGSRIVTRVNEFRARDGCGDELGELLGSFLPMIAAAAGCRFCRLLQGSDDPDRLLVIEEWDSMEAHRAAATEIPSDALERAMALLDGAPSGAYFDDRTER